MKVERCGGCEEEPCRNKGIACKSRSSPLKCPTRDADPEIKSGGKRMQRMRGIGGEEHGENKEDDGDDERSAQLKCQRMMRTRVRIMRMLQRLNMIQMMPKTGMIKMMRMNQS